MSSIAHTADALGPDQPIPRGLAVLAALPWWLKAWIAARPLAWRYYSALCRRAGWNASCLGWHTPANGPCARIRLRAFHANHLWALVGTREVGVSVSTTALLSERAWREHPGEVWDIGACHGHFALLCVRQGARHVLAIEPAAPNIEGLREHLAANPALAERIEVLQAAISDRDGSVVLALDGTDGTLNQIQVPGVPQYARGARPSTSTVDARQVDSLVAARGAAPGLIKIDVEGAEALVLAGAAQVLRTARPIVLVEIHSQEAGEACVRLLTDAGYACSRIRPDGSLAPLGRDLSGGHLLARPRP